MSKRELSKNIDGGEKGNSYYYSILLKKYGKKKADKMWRRKIRPIYQELKEVGWQI